MSENARLLDDMAERMFAQFLSDPLDRLDATLPARLKAAADEAGLSLTLLPEDDGGMGATLEEAAIVAWRAGYHAAPVPIVTLLLAPTLGDLPVALDDLALAAPGTDVAEGPAGHIALVSGEGIAIHKAEYAFEALDHRPWVRATGPALHVITGEGLAARLEMQGAVLTAAAMLGAMEKVLDTTITYANTRKQFGRALSAFQAIQHRLAEAAEEYTITQAAVAGAVRAIDGGWSRPVLWQSAKVQSARAATSVAACAHQILGAIGFTEEHELHHYTKKLWVWRDAWGRQSALETAIGGAAAAHEDGLWSFIADTPIDTIQAARAGEAA